MKSFLYLLWLGLLLSSCELLQSPSPSSNEEDTLSSPFLLTQIEYMYDPPVAALHQFFYDGQSRLVKSISYGYNHSLYKYNSKNQVEIVNTFYTSSKGDTMSHYSDKKYSYNSQGKWVKCVITNGDTLTYATMSYGLNRETVHIYYPDEKILAGKVTYEYRNGQVMKRTSEDFGDYPSVQVITYEYSDKNNSLGYPDKVLHYQFNRANRYGDFPNPHTLSKKLISKITYNDSRGYDGTTEYSYEFDSNGLPTKVITNSFSSSGSYINKYAYKYVKR
jgi:hypothetical protein